MAPITRKLAHGYTENLVDPFPVFFDGRIRTFRELPHIAPRYKSFPEKVIQQTHEKLAKEQASHEAGFVNRSKQRTNSPAGPIQTGFRVPEREGGSIITQNA